MAYHNKHKKQPKYVLFKTFKELSDKYEELKSQKVHEFQSETPQNGLNKEKAANVKPKEEKSIESKDKEFLITKVELKADTNKIRIEALEVEIKTLPEKGEFANKRRKFLLKRLEEAKYNQ